LASRGVAFSCNLVGDGPLRSDVEGRIARRHLSDRVHVLGPHTRQQVVSLLAASDAAVLASAPTSNGKREGIPVALMEAMSAGLPVVATRTGGIPELVESGVAGFLVEPGDVEGLATSLERLATDRELGRRMGAAGREAVLREFDETVNAARLMRLFERWRPDDAPVPRTIGLNTSRACAAPER
jgi:glycosyltransferase involved in cell wall biosynthesis